MGLVSVWVCRLLGTVQIAPVKGVNSYRDRKAGKGETERRKHNDGSKMRDLAECLCYPGWGILALLGDDKSQEHQTGICTM